MRDPLIRYTARIQCKKFQVVKTCSVEIISLSDIKQCKSLQLLVGVCRSYESLQYTPSKSINLSKCVYYGGAGKDAVK